jgi:hypothetical protein
VFATRKALFGDPLTDRHRPCAPVRRNAASCAVPSRSDKCRSFIRLNSRARERTVAKHRNCNRRVTAARTGRLFATWCASPCPGKALSSGNRLRKSTRCGREANKHGALRQRVFDPGADAWGPQIRMSLPHYNCRNVSRVGLRAVCRMCSNSAEDHKLGGCVLFVHKRSALFALLRGRVSPGLSGQNRTDDHRRSSRPG